jgi:hypothetical protein
MITQPTDVVRTRMQLALAGTTRGNALQTLAHVFKTQGPRALLSGAAPRVLKRTTQTALVRGPAAPLLLLLLLAGPPLLLLALHLAPLPLLLLPQAPPPRPPQVWTLYEELLPRLSALALWAEQAAAGGGGKGAAGGAGS